MKNKHDGDCNIYRRNGICTCGYFHDILPHIESLPTDQEELFDRHMFLLSYLADMDKVDIPKNPPLTISDIEKLWSDDVKKYYNGET